MTISRPRDSDFFSHSLLGMFKDVLKDPVQVYVLFLLSVPQGVLDLFSPFNFKTPRDIHYDLLDSPVSLLFLPILIYAAYHLITAYRPALKLRLLVPFWLLFLLWQPFNAHWAPHPQKTEFTGELFFAYGMAFSFLYTVSARQRTTEGLIRFLIVFSSLQCFGAMGGLFLGQKSLLARINAPNLDIGNSSLLFGAFALILAVRPGPQRYLALSPIPLQMLTGSRSTLILTLILLPFAIASAAPIKSTTTSRGRTLNGVVWGVVALGILLASAKLLSPQNTDVASRMSSLADPSQLESDSSTLGRLASMLVGLQVLRANPLGLPFSLIELQHMMNRFGYPTFPHNNLLVIMIIFGPFCLVIFFLIIQTGIRIFKSSSPYRFCFMYFLIYSIMAGGCMPYFKPVFIYILFFLLFMRSTEHLAEPRSVTQAVPLV